MKTAWLIFCVALAVMLFACASPAAATDYYISSSGSNLPGGYWDAGTKTFFLGGDIIVSSSDTLAIGPGATLTINGGVDFLVEGNGWNRGIINNYGLFTQGNLFENFGIINNYGQFYNKYLFENFGIINNYGLFYNKYLYAGCINNYPGGLIFNGDLLSVNTPPTLNPIGDQVMNEGDTLTITLSASDSDPPPQTLTYSTDFSFFSQNDNEFTWTPGDGDAGSYDVEFSVTDGCAVVSETITITVKEVTDPEEIPEFSTIAVPVATILGLLFLFNHRKRRKED